MDLIIHTVVEDLSHRWITCAPTASGWRNVCEGIISHAKRPLPSAGDGVHFQSQVRGAYSWYAWKQATTIVSRSALRPEAARSHQGPDARREAIAPGINLRTGYW
jgi:hypothetical protein